MRATLAVAGLCLLAVLGAPTVHAAAPAGFPSFHPGYPPPPDWTGPVFSLSQDYPAEEPAPEAYPWLEIDFETRPFDYLRAVLAYGVEGNVEVDWRVAENTVRPWYHAPWMHTGCGGREFARGMTRERSSRPRELHPDQTEWVDNWAVGIYNAPGGWVLGQVWGGPVPEPTLTDFPLGTVGFKLLFTAATAEEVPYLANSLAWQAHIYPATGDNPCSDPVAERPRVMREMLLLQLDVAIRDERSEETGWVFGTFVYDASQPGESPFDRLVPVGLMWGNDPGVAEEMNREGAFVNPALTESIVNADLVRGDDFPPERAFVTHFGLGGRVNGPVDNPISSCMSCHGLAASPSQVVVPRGVSGPAAYRAADLATFFTNVPPGPIDTGSFVRLDYSLQIGFGIRAHALCTNDPDLEGCGTVAVAMAEAVTEDAAPLEPGAAISREGEALETVVREEEAPPPPAEPVEPEPAPGSRSWLWILLAAVVLLTLLWLVRRKRT